jgi:hypothetical protein
VSRSGMSRLGEMRSNKTDQQPLSHSRLYLSVFVAYQPRDGGRRMGRNVPHYKLRMSYRGDGETVKMAALGLAAKMAVDIS